MLRPSSEPLIHRLARRSAPWRLDERHRRTDRRCRAGADAGLFEVAALRLAGLIDNTLLLLEHPPVLTLGRNASRANVLASDELLESRGVTLHEINRGGDVTYHGPGQLVGYPIFDLRSLQNSAGGRLGPVDFVRMMEEALIRVCGVYGVRAGRIAGLTGVWCGLHDDPPRERKIGAIGIHVSRGITSHGFAFNVTTDLRDFQLINPCGITDKPVTSLNLEISEDITVPSLENIAHQAASQFGHVFSQQVLALDSLDTLRAHAEATNNFPANDTPLQIPSATSTTIPTTPPRPDPRAKPHRQSRFHSASEWRVSGHDFSRAAKAKEERRGFSPCECSRSTQLKSETWQVETVLSPRNL